MTKKAKIEDKVELMEETIWHIERYQRSDIEDNTKSCWELLKRYKKQQKTINIIKVVLVLMLLIQLLGVN